MEPKTKQFPKWAYLLTPVVLALLPVIAVVVIVLAPLYFIGSVCVGGLCFAFGWEAPKWVMGDKDD